MNALTLSNHDNPAGVYLASLSSDTGRRTQAQALRVVAQIMGVELMRVQWHTMRYQHTAFVRAELMQRYSPASANKILSALRQTLKQAWLLRQMTAEDYQMAIQVKRVIGETIPAGRELSQGEILALINACQTDVYRKGEKKGLPHPAGIRDAAMIGLLYACGLRRQEIVNLSTGSYDRDTGQLVLTGKRNKQRTAYVTNGAMDALHDWLKIRGLDHEALFVAINKSGKLDTGKPLTPQAVYNIMAKRAKQAGVKEFSPHDLRRTFVSDLLDKGADISTVSKMAGHQNVQTTQRYDRRPEEAKRKAAGLLHLPYKRQP